jgi:hypothetical protein
MTEKKLSQKSPKKKLFLFFFFVLLYYNNVVRLKKCVLVTFCSSSRNPQLQMGYLSVMHVYHIKRRKVKIYKKKTKSKRKIFF